MSSDQGFHGAASRLPPPTTAQPQPQAPPRLARLSGHATPPIAASGSNRVPVITRNRSLSSLHHLHPQHSHSHSPSLSSTSSSTQRHATYSLPFPLPDYLKHSTYADRFFTTPVEQPPFFSGTTTSTTEAGDVEMVSGPAAPPTSTSGGGGGTLSASHSLSEGLASLSGDGRDAQSTILLPTCWDEEDRCALIELSSDALGASFAGSAKYGDRDAAAVRTNRPIPPQAAVYYFEITIIDKGQSGYIGIGFSHRNVSLSRLPGWEDHSFGYHGDDGRAFCCLGTGEPFGPTFTTGDTVGCGIDWTGVGPAPSPTIKEQSRKGGKEDLIAGSADRKKGQGGRAFFTKNGEFLGYAFQGLHGKLYPSVGLRTPGETVRANFGSEPFKFDIEALVRERQRSVASFISTTSVPSTLLLPSPSPPIPSLLPPSSSERTSETLQTLISSYLIHHGYAETASAFATQVIQERRERAKGLIPSATPASTTATTVDTQEEDDATLSSLLSIGSDSLVRGSIRSTFLRGDAEKVLELTKKHYPAVLEEEKDDELGGWEFRLRVRAFVEAVIRAGSATTTTTAGGSEMVEKKVDLKGKARASTTTTTTMEQDDDASMRPLDEPTEEEFTTPPGSPTPSDQSHSSSSSLDYLLSLGRSLHADYSSDQRPAVQHALRLTFSLMAYDDPASVGGEVGKLLSREQRAEEADKLNSAILVSQFLPPIPHLESLYRQTMATVQLLGDMGVGSAALVDPRSELLMGGKRRV